MATSEEIFRDAMALPPDARAELTERLVESPAQDVSPEITATTCGGAAAHRSGRVGRLS